MLLNIDPAISNALAIAVGAIPGALSRYYVTEWSKKVLGNKFPYGTFVINITGCFVMGLFITLIEQIKDFPTVVRLMVAPGFLGAYTTFSTYGFDTLTMWRSKNITVTCFYCTGSIIFGVIGVLLGISLARLISN